MTRTCVRSCLTALLLLLASHAGADGGTRPNSTIPTYRAVDLGVLPGQLYSLAAGINDRGDVIGTSASNRQNLSDQSHATLFSHGAVIDLGVPAGDTFTNGYGINDRGEGIGIVGALADPSLDPTPFAALFAGGRVLQMTSPGGGYAFGQAINRRGQGAGFGYVGTQLHALLFDRGPVVDLGVLPGGSFSLAYALNNRGVAAGQADAGGGFTHAALFDHGAVTDIDTSGNQESSNAEGINDAGLTVGQVQGATYHAFLYRNGAMIDLMPPGASYSDAAAINNQGQIAGNAYYPASGIDYGVLWANGEIVLLDPLPGYQDSTATAINDRGQIVGYSTNPTGGWRATLWVPERRFSPPQRKP